MDPDPHNWDAEALLARQGDHAAFHRLVVGLHTDVRLFLGAHGLDLDLIEELTQATFVTAFRKLDRYEPRGAFRAWLKAIARNHLLHELRERRRWAKQQADGLELLAIEDCLDGAEDTAQRERELDRLRGCLQNLSASARQLLEQRYSQQCSSAEIAALLARTESWVRVTLHRIRRSLRGCMESST